MSADPPRKAYKYTCSMIRPQIYSEKSLMESVVDFFSDVVPQAYTGTQKNEDREKIQWVRFENCDCNDVAKNPDMFRSDTKGLPLLLILGYSNGVQIWHITPNGEAQEVLSMRQGPVRICRILPNPDPVLGNNDSYSYKRPLIVMCDSSSAGQPYCGVKFVSLKTGDEVHSISYKTLPVQNIECNKRFLVIVFLEKVCVYEACQFQQLFWITSCYPCPGPTVNPIALSTRWLAYADKRLVAMHQSCGGMSGDGSQSYAATVISAAKGAFKGLSMFGEAMVSSVTGCKPTAVKRDCVQLDNGNRPGIVTVVDIQNIHNDHFNVNEDNEGDGLIGHFHAHANEPVSNMAFDPTGTLLVTACKLGHNFHVFRLMAHPVSSSLGAVHHLYTLHRGETTAKVIDISFNHDSRWITVSSHRGTTHLFPITPYGGPVNIRTHCKPHVVNRASRFHRSAGLDEFDHSVGRRSPVLSTSPSSSGQYDRYPTLIQQNTLNNNMGNPRLPPYPHPITIYPAFQVKQPLNVALNPGNKNQSPSHSPTGFDNVYCVCAKFCTPRLCVIGSPKLDVERRDGGKRPVDSLFVMAQSGTLVEYVLEPRAKSVSDKVTDDCLLELNVVGRMQWNVQRLKNSPELRPPLPSNSPLILAHEAVVSQVPTAPDLYDLPGLTRQDSKDSLSSEHSSKDDSDEQWLSQVEIITHAGPHRRLWMGPQFSFKTYQENTTVLSSNSSSLLSQSPESNMAAMDMLGDEGDLESLKLQPARSNPVSMPNARPAYRRLSGSDSPSTVQGIGAQSVPLLIEAGSFDQSPHLLDVYSNWTESTVAKQPRGSDDLEEDRLKETLADAMVESPCKDLEKLSLRHQDIPRASVKAEKARGQSGKKIAERNTEGVASHHKKADVQGKAEAEKVKSNVEEKKGKQSETTMPKDKKGKGNSGKQDKTEEQGIPVSVEVPKSEKVKADLKTVEVAAGTGKNGKKKGNSRKSLDAQFTNSSTTAKKGEIKSSTNDTKVEKQCDKIVQDKNSVQSNLDESTAKDKAAKVKSVKLSNNLSARVNDKSEKDDINNVKSTAKINVNAANNECTEIADSTVDKQNTKEEKEEKDFQLELVKNKQKDNMSSSVSVKPALKLVAEVKINVETGNAKESLVNKEKANNEEVKVTALESPSKGKSKRKNKKQNKNVMNESVNEKSSNGETNEICKQLSETSICEKSEMSGKGNSPGSTVAKTETLESVTETAECTVKVELSSGSLDQESNNTKKMEELLSLDSKVESENSKMDVDESDMQENVPISCEHIVEKSSFDTSAKSKSKKNKKNNNTNEKDFVETNHKTKKMEKTFKEEKKECGKKEFKTVEMCENKVSTRESDENYTREIDEPVVVKKKLSIEQEENTLVMQSKDEVKSQNNESKDQKQPLEIKSSITDKEQKKSDIYDCEQEMFEVKSKKKRKKKKNGMEDSLYVDIPNEAEKQTPLCLQAKESFQAEKEGNIDTTSAADNSFVGEVASDCTVPTDTGKIPIKTSQEIEKVSETEWIAAKDENAIESSIEKGSPIVGKDVEKSSRKYTATCNESVENLKEVERGALLENREKLKGEPTEEEMFVVPKRKNKRKKKSEETNLDSSRSSSETEIIESKSETTEKSSSNQNKVKKTKESQSDKDRLKGVPVVKSKTDETSENLDDGSLEKKSNKTLGKENSEENVVIQSKDEDDDEIVVMIDKKMEDSAESGSKYETAESAEDDPSAWERFEECTEDNESERDTAVESNSNILSEKSNEWQVGQDMSASFGKDNSVDIDQVQMHKTDKGIEKLKFTESERNEKASKRSSIDEADKAVESGNKVDVGASVMVMSMYDESAGSSSRSSEERDVIGKGKNASEKETKSKKKKRKNKK